MVGELCKTQNAHGIGIAWIQAVSHEVLFTYLRPIITDFEVASGELWMYILMKRDAAVITMSAVSLPWVWSRTDGSVGNIYDKRVACIL